ncbi:MAG: hypothetical protein Q9182_004949 [Xanthomendoza sp. 2 TL-2023]
MGPRDTRDSTEPDRNVHPAGKDKGKAKISWTSSNASLGDLMPEAVDTGIAAVRQIAKILRFAQGYHEEIGDVERIYGLGIRQLDRIDELETTVTNLAFRRDQEMAKLRDENDAYEANARQFLLGKEELERQRAKINRAKQGFLDQSNTRVNQIRAELEKKIQALETEKDGFRDTTKKLEEKNIQAKKDLKKQKESFELDKRSSQSHLMRLESELNQINTASKGSRQTPGF